MTLTILVKNSNVLMEIINADQIKKILWPICIVTLIMTIGPIIIYACKFDGELSNDQAKWGAFGDYIGGIIGTIFNLAAVIFSLLSIYITLKIATRIHENEQNFNTDNIKREAEKFNREIELIQKQNKPFPSISFHKYIDKIEVVLSNEGPGTLIVSRYEIFYGNEVFLNFGELVENKAYKPNYSNVMYGYDSANKLTLSSGSSKTLFIMDIKEENQTTNIQIFETFQKKCKDVIEKATVKFFYEDIFENTYEIEEGLEL